MIFADTSFLFSLFGNDAHTRIAHRWVNQAGRPITISVFNRYELANAIRFAAFRKVISRAEALGSLAAFEADIGNGNLQLATCDWIAVVAEASHLSEYHTWRGGHRSFDILHVATARIMKASTFLTFDTNQAKLAASAKLTVGP